METYDRVMLNLHKKCVSRCNKSYFPGRDIWGIFCGKILADVRITAGMLHQVSWSHRSSVNCCLILFEWVENIWQVIIVAIIHNMMIVMMGMVLMMFKMMVAAEKLGSINQIRKRWGGMKFESLVSAENVFLLDSPPHLPLNTHFLITWHSFLYFLFSFTDWFLMSHTLCWETDGVVCWSWGNMNYPNLTRNINIITQTLIFLFIFFSLFSSLAPLFFRVSLSLSLPIILFINKKHNKSKSWFISIKNGSVETLFWGIPQNSNFDASL